MNDNVKFLHQAQKSLGESINNCFKEIEHYIYYALRCLYRCGITTRPYYGEDFTHVIQENTTHAVVYPKSSIVPGEGVINPMFFFGFKIVGLHVVFSEDPKELGMRD